MSSNQLKIMILGDASNAKEAFGQVQAAAAQTATAITAAVGAATAIFAGIEGKVISVSSEFERFQTQLTTIEGSATAAKASMDWITQFTAKTPFELAQVTDAFVKLKSFGIDPISNDALKTLGDTAAAMGKPLNQAVEALADAATGEFERLKEFGIKAKVTGDQVAFSYSQNGQQMVASADKNSQEMLRATLLGIWNDKYKGGMDALSQTWDGMVSNLSDKWTLFQKNIGDAGAFDAAKGLLSGLLDELQKNDEEIKALARDISGGLVSGLEVGTMSAGVMAKVFATLPVVMNAVRLGIDSVALVSVQGFDLMLSAAQTYMEVVQHIPGMIGDDAKNDLASIKGLRAEIGHLQEGIKATGNESLNTFLDSTVEAEASWKAIDKKVVSVFALLEKARNPQVSADKPDVKSGGGGSSKALDSSAGLTPAQIKAAKDAEAERSQLAGLSIERQRSESLSKLDMRKEEINRMRQMGLISESENIQALKALSGKTMAIELKAARAHAALIKDKPVAYQKAMDKIESIQRKHDLGMKKLNTKTALETKKTFDKMFAPITSAFQKSVNGMIQGTLTFRKAMKQMGQSIVLEFASMGVKMVVEWVKNEALKTVATEGGILTRLGLEESGAAMSLLISAGTAMKQIMMSAWQVMANVYNAIAAIPIVGPFIAPVAAAGAFAVVAGYASNIASASGGYDIPAGVNPMTQLHQQEMVLPAHIANPLRDMLSGGGAAASGGNTTIVVQAMDARSFKQYLTRNASSLPPALKKLKRNFSA